MKLFYRELGEGRPIVILHGVFGSSDNWLTPAKMLSDNYKLYLLDQRNHGQSPKSDVFDYESMANDLKEFIEEHQLNAPVIMGHSMGGKVAMAFAVKYPQLLSKLIVVDISPNYYPPHHQKIIEGLNSIDLKSLQTRQEADSQFSKYEPELGVRQFLLKNLYRSESNNFEWRINLPIITEKIENVGEALDQTSKVSVPTLFVKGGSSRYIREKDEALIKKIFLNVKLASIEGAGHWVHAEKPQEFIDVVRGFL
jgi:pimeloyl-ACP methyl ester carboxylesterase